MEEYLESSFTPPCEYVDGAMIPRVEAEHNFKFVKCRIVAFFEQFEDSCHVRALTDQRICCALDSGRRRYRVADVSIVRRPVERVSVLHQPPLLVAEILRTGEDSAVVLGRLSDFARFGVPHIWALDIDGGKVFTVSARGLHEVTVANLPIPELSLQVSVRGFFSELE